MLRLFSQIDDDDDDNDDNGDEDGDDDVDKYDDMTTALITITISRRIIIVGVGTFHSPQPKFHLQRSNTQHK